MLGDGMARVNSVDRIQLMEWLGQRAARVRSKRPDAPLRAYKLWFFDPAGTSNYAGADIDVVALAQSPEEGLLRLEWYIFTHTRHANLGTPISLIDNALESLELDRSKLQGERQRRRGGRAHVDVVGQAVLRELFDPNNDTIHIESFGVLE